MKPEEAIEILELPKDPLKSGTHYHAIPSPKRISCTDYLNARKVAIAALEKQVPKKPIEKHYVESGNPTYTKTTCPNGCRVQVNKGEYAYSNNYCHKCGQKLDWSDPKHD